MRKPGKRGCVYFAMAYRGDKTSRVPNLVDRKVMASTLDHMTGIGMGGAVIGMALGGGPVGALIGGIVGALIGRGFTSGK